jgi:hypothetical protein
VSFLSFSIKLIEKGSRECDAPVDVEREKERKRERERAKETERERERQRDWVKTSLRICRAKNIIISEF